MKRILLAVMLFVGAYGAKGQFVYTAVNDATLGCSTLNIVGFIAYDAGCGVIDHTTSSMPTYSIAPSAGQGFEMGSTIVSGTINISSYWNTYAGSMPPAAQFGIVIKVGACSSITMGPCTYSSYSLTSCASCLNIAQWTNNGPGSDDLRIY